MRSSLASSHLAHAAHHCYTNARRPPPCVVAPRYAVVRVLAVHGHAVAQAAPVPTGCGRHSPSTPRSRRSRWPCRPCPPASSARSCWSNHRSHLRRPRLCALTRRVGLPAPLVCCLRSLARALAWLPPCACLYHEGLKAAALVRTATCVLSFFFSDSCVRRAFYRCTASCEAGTAGEQRKYRREEETKREKRKII
jgi:hypothetical protein